METNTNKTPVATTTTEPVAIRKATPAPTNGDSLFPRTINASSRTEGMTKSASFVTPGDGMISGGMNSGSVQSTSYRSPQNRYYSPDTTNSSIYLPKNNDNKNAWRRWIAAHDPIVGAVAETYTEMPWSKAEVLVDDPYIQKVYMDAMDECNFFAKCQQIDHEFFKIGETITVFNFNETKGYIDHIVIENPNFIEIKGSPLIGDQQDIYLKPDQELKKIITSTDPHLRDKKKMIDRRIVEAVMYGRNILLPPEYTIHMARRENPTDSRGTSIIDRLFKMYMLEDKILEGVLATVDNHMYPLKIFKLGNAATGWIPPESHSRALAELLQQAQFDPNFSLIYHYGLCLTPETPVTINDGTTKSVKDLRVGDRLMGGTGGERIITGMSERQENEKIISLTIVGVPEPTELTKEHHVIAVVRDKCVGTQCVTHEDGTIIHSHYCNQDWNRRKWNAKPQEVASDVLQHGDYLLSPIKGYEEEYTVEDNFARLLGYYVSDGCAFPLPHKTQSLFGFKFTFNSVVDQEYVDDVINITKNDFYINTQIYKRSEKCVSVDCYSPCTISTIIANELMRLGGKPNEKSLSEEIFHWPELARGQLLIGLFRGDGHTSEDFASFCSSKRQLINQVVRLMHTLSFAPLLYEEVRDTGFGVFTAYIIRICGEQGRRLKDMIDTGKYIKWENKKLKFSDSMPWNGWIYNKIKKVERKAYQGSVYNIEVDGDHLYLANFMCTHNSYEQHGMEGRVMNFDKYFDRVDKMKMIALGINNSFLTGETTYASASSFLSVMLSRLKTKRDMYEASWMKKFFKIIAEKNDFYKREKKEIVGHYRVAKSKDIKHSELIFPKLAWHKSLSIREDATYLNYLKELFDKGKGPVSMSTMLAAAGLETEQELKNKKRDRLMELQIGVEAYPAEDTKGGGTSNEGLFASFKGKREKYAKDKDLDASFFLGVSPVNQSEYQHNAEQEEDTDKIVSVEKQSSMDDNIYLDIVDKFNVPSNVKKIFSDVTRADDFKLVMASLYEEGKIKSYMHTGYLDVKIKLASMDIDNDSNSFVMDVQDEILIEDFAMQHEAGYDKKKLALDAYFMGQLQGLHEQGIETVNLKYADDHHRYNGKKYKVSDLLDSNNNWSRELYPNFEMISIEPEISNFENTFDFNIIPVTQTITSNKVLIENVPIEYKHASLKIAMIMPSSIKKISFVQDITKSKEWTEWRREYYKNAGFDKNEDEPIIMGLLSKDIKNNQDRVFIHSGNMYIDYTIGRKDGLFEDLFSNELSSFVLAKDNVKEAIASDYSEILDKQNLSLDSGSIDVLSADGIILPIVDKKSDKTVGWQINKEAIVDINTSYANTIKEAQAINGKWNLNGEPLFNIKNISNINKFIVNEICESMKVGKRSKVIDKIMKMV